MKIKVKKEMRLDELIKWAWDNPELVRGEKFYPQGNRYETCVYFHLYDGRRCLMRDFIKADDTFEVEYEEEITEETKFDRLLEVYEIQEGVYKSALHKGISLNERFEDDNIFPTKAFYILNDDLTMTLIWKDGELVK
ncbi:TPA: hypothetical protein ACN3DE_001596 [Staphylococcus aureus]|uniref:hypothetical protein n=1 Tax=Staphylococcus aureus TaxID=1280 RepID=UPI000806A973|nr:hypothetical protein [Staphylococcus aureus]MBH4765552.1 hypothetical protein [Staphylococcus aureus]MBH4798907.1 hypothetical protein [Staphylococcus aureus]MBH4801551.1 hypothetical protein [Staphylococcus aureus]MBH4806209.1 hypothetical protein [Staphylococcus aureus]MBH4821829.1 hypothetical protein [Staphylococcus aureus]